MQFEETKMIQRNVDRRQTDDLDELQPGQDVSDRIRASGSPPDRVWPRTLFNGFSTFALACAAAYTSTRSTDKGVGMTAWIAVAIVGTASAIASSGNPRAKRK
jgi:hypothetical protein